MQLSKDLSINGRDTQIFHYKVGGTQNPYSFSGAQNFFWKKVWKYFSKHIKAKGMTQFSIVHILVENLVNLLTCLFWALLQATKIWNSSKNAQVWAA